MDLKQLERFVVTAEHGSIGGAAIHLGLSQPALTRSIQMLEDTLGSPLFDRVSRGVKLTVLGAKILPYARLMVRERLRLKEIADEINGQLGGLISLGVTDNLIDIVAAEAVVEFRRKWPDIRIAVSDGLVGDVLDKLHDGTLDLALCTLGFHAIPEALSFDRLFDSMVSIVVRKDHPLAFQKTASFRELSAANWIV